MRFFILVLILAFDWTLPAALTTPDWIQVKSFSSATPETAMYERGVPASKLTTDQQGNVFVIATYPGGTVRFDPGQSISNGVGFIAKFDSAGSCLWLRNLTRGQFTDLAVDAETNLIVAGHFSAALRLDGTNALTASNPPLGVNAFLMKFSPAGTLLWARKALTDQVGPLTSLGKIVPLISCATNGEIHLAAHCNNSEIYWSRFSPAGELLAFTNAASQVEVLNSIQLSPEGSMYLCGGFGWREGTSEVYPAHFQHLTLTNAGTGPDTDGYIAKLDGAGQVLWAKRIGSPGLDMARALVVTGNGHITVCGWFGGALTIEGEVKLDSSGFRDGFVMQFGSGGEYLWAQPIAGSGDEYAHTITTDPTGALLAGGFFGSRFSDGMDGQATFGKDGSQVTFRSAGPWALPDLFIAKYQTDGTLAWVLPGGGSGQESVHSLASDSNGQIVALGLFNPLPGDVSQFPAPNQGFTLSGTGTWMGRLAIVPKVHFVAFNEGTARVTVSGPNGQAFRLESSTNLTLWTQVGATTLADTNQILIDTNIPSPRNRYYRLALP